MEVTLAVVADYANISQEGKLNIMGIFDTIQAERLPVVHPTMKLVTTFEFSRAEEGYKHPFEVRLIDADGKRLLSLNGAINPKGGNPGQPIKANSILSLNNIKFERAGSYAFVIMVDDEAKRSVRLNVWVSTEKTDQEG